jgi:hypothetical protein
MTKVWIEVKKINNREILGLYTFKKKKKRMLGFLFLTKSLKKSQVDLHMNNFISKIYLRWMGMCKSFKKKRFKIKNSHLVFGGGGGRRF